MRNFARATLAALLAAAALTASGTAARAQDLTASGGADVRATARRMLEANRDAVIHVKAALKLTISFGGQEMPGQDQQVELLGTVIDPSGLTVLSEADLNPGGMLSGLGGMFGGGDDGEGVSMKSDVGDVKMVLKDGREVPARVVLRDKDLDLAFVVPNEKGGKFAAVSLDGARVPEVLDEVIVVGRLGRNLDRASAVTIARVSAIVRKPRTFYVCDVGAAVFATGCPAFDASGRPLGIFLQRRAAPSGSGGLADLVGGMMPVVLPCDDVKEVAEQAMAEAAKPPAEEKKAGEPKPEEPAPPAEKGDAGEKKPEEPAKEPPK